MNSEDTAAAIKAIRLIAKTQAKLVSRAGASAKHTELVLREIAERCATITPSKRFNGKAEIDEQLTRFLEGTIGFCAATREEEHGIWSSLVDHRDPPLTWRQHGGLGVTIGYLDNRPVHVSLSHVDVGGHKVIFYHATSTVVDHDMVRAFLDIIAPETAKEGARLNHSDATNFTNILPRGWQTTQGTET